jgi:hypothetical protein
VCSAQYLLHHIFRNLVEKLRILRLHVEESFDLEARVKNKEMLCLMEMLG